MAFLTLDRSAALADRDGRVGTDVTSITDGAFGSATLTGRPSTTLVGTKIVASAAPPKQFVGRDVIGRLTANGALLAKSLIYQSLFVLVSAIALIYKFFLFTLIYVMAPLFPAEFDRDVIIGALNEIEKDSQFNE
jgi:hypothetical protein